MNKKVLTISIIIYSINLLQAQIYTPGAVLQGSTTNNNIGIGTNTPNEKLVINGNGARLKLQTNSAPTNYYTFIESNYNAANTFNIVDGGHLKFGAKTMGILSSDTYMSSYYGLAFLTNTTSAQNTNIRMYINQIGNVGIGTTNPTSKLTVAGNINAREVKVTVNAGADFVFEKDYKLPSLESVAEFIKENKHLPEIVSAQEMQKDGINLSEMNIKLLQKIEEMTLYMIEMKKENESLKNNQKVLENRIQKIESR